MSTDRRDPKRLADLLPAGILGISTALAAAHADAKVASAPPAASGDPAEASVAVQLQGIREQVTAAIEAAQAEREAESKVRLAWWGNWGHGGLGWRNGGWRNGGWRNGGWRNGGWNNWGNGWNNWGNGGWNNFWHNW